MQLASNPASGQDAASSSSLPGSASPVGDVLPSRSGGVSGTALPSDEENPDPLIPWPDIYCQIEGCFITSESGQVSRPRRAIGHCRVCSSWLCNAHCMGFVQGKPLCIPCCLGKKQNQEAVDDDGTPLPWPSPRHVMLGQGWVLPRGPGPQPLPQPSPQHERLGQGWLLPRGPPPLTPRQRQHPY